MGQFAGFRSGAFAASGSVWPSAWLRSAHELLFVAAATAAACWRRNSNIQIGVCVLRTCPQGKKMGASLRRSVAAREPHIARKLFILHMWPTRAEANHWRRSRSSTLPLDLEAESYRASSSSITGAQSRPPAWRVASNATHNLLRDDYLTDNLLTGESLVLAAN